MASTSYDENFFAARQAGSLASARKIVPFLIEATGCRSLVDVGCGIGTWLAVAREQGLETVRGLDGAYVNRQQLLIPEEDFRETDLRDPPAPDRAFDLAISMEVAEHLPPAAGEGLIDLLTGFSPVVAFSASAPFQHGTDHINEQWLDYWIERFQRRGYVALDCIRPRVWNDPEVDWWYAQNALLYVRADELPRYPRLVALQATLPPPLACVHPRHLMHMEEEINRIVPLGQVWSYTLTRTWQALQRALGRRPTLQPLGGAHGQK